MTELIDKSLEESREDREKRKAERYRSDIRFMVKSPEGRRLYWAWMAKGGIFSEPFVQGMNDQTLYNLGYLGFSRELLNDLLSAKPEAYVEMQQEYASEKAKEEAIDKKLEERQGLA